MESLGLTSKAIDPTAQSSELNALAREILQHKEEDKSRSYLSKFIVSVTEGFHGNNKALERMDALQTSLMASKMAGDIRGVEEAQKKIGETISQDVTARRSAQSWSDHSAGFAKSVGLFFPGKAGYVMSAVTNASDSARPEDSMGRQVVDGMLGAGKGAALKWGFDKVGQSQMNLMLKAGTLSVTNRLAEVGLNSHTYFDAKTGDFDPLGGLWKTGKAVADPKQLVADAITFGAGYYALGKLGVTPEFARANPIVTQALTGGTFGFSSGFFADVQMQQKYGEGFNMTSAVKSGLLQMTLDGAAATIGGVRMQQMQNRAAESTRAETQGVASLTGEAPGKMDFSRLKEHVDGVLGFDNRPIARPHGVAETRVTIPGAEGVYGLDNKPVAQPRAAETKGLPAESVEGVYGLDKRPVAQPRQNLSVSAPEGGIAKAEMARTAVPQATDAGSIALAKGPGIREFVSAENVSRLIPALQEQGANAQALLKVREIIGGTDSTPKLGPERTLLVQHLEAGAKVPLERMSAADLLATCDPKLLESLGVKNVAGRHIFPDAGASKVMLQVPGSNRLRFSLPEALTASEFAAEPAFPLGGKDGQAIPKRGSVLEYNLETGKGMTVPEWLKAIDTKHRMSDLHDVQLIARALERHNGSASHVPIERFLGGGNETIAFLMKDGQVLRVTDKNFRPEWGKRTIEVNGVETQFDARILGQKVELQVGDKTITYYTQTKGITPVKQADVDMFNRLIERDGRYVFWDNDFSSWGQSQLAYVPLLKMENGRLTAIPVSSRAGMSNRGLALIDYDAVRIAGTEPKQTDGSGRGWGSWRYGNYDFEPFDR